MRLTETCSCGASIDVADQWPVSVARRLFEFRAAHEPCRQPPQARQANTGPPTSDDSDRDGYRTKTTTTTHTAARGGSSEVPHLNLN